MSRFNLPLVGIVLAVFAASCNTDLDYDAMKAEENRYFKIYMDANYPDSVPRSSGLYYFNYKEGSGQMADTGDYILINYLAYTIPDEEVVDTYTEEWAVDYGLYSSGVLYGPYKYKHGTEIEGMKEGISLMKEGGIARLIFKSDLGYGSTEFGSIDMFESLMYDIELVKVIGDAEEADAYEKQQMADYLATIEDGYVTEIYDSATNATMYYILETVGDSIPLRDELAAEVYYTGKLLDGRVFDTNAESSSGFDVTVGAGDVISGWDIGLKYFRYGGKGKLLIPHELAYGADGILDNTTNKTSIPPYEALLFDIEVTKTVVETE